jgi:protease IV
MKYILILAFMLSLTCMFAQSPSTYNHSFNFNDAPVAATDDYLAPLVNPAAMGRENSGGFTFMQPYMNDKYLNPYSVFINTGDIAYVIQKENNHLNYNTLAFGGDLSLGKSIPNMYIGMGYDWKNKDFKYGDIRSSWLWAPHNALSLGFVLTHPFEMAPVYRFGAGIRPLIRKGKVSNRIEFTGDMNYAMDSDGERGFLKPILGMNSEVINGIKIGGSYNMESETYGLTFSFHAKKSASGSRMHIEEHNNYMYDYVTASDKVFRTYNGKKKSAYYELGIKQTLVDQKKGMKFGPFYIVDGKQTAMMDVLKKIDKIADEKEIGGILFRNANFAASFAHRQELIDALREYKAKGKLVIFYFDNIGNGSYAFAAAIADKIYMNPLGTVDLRGIALNSPYLKELADTLGIDFISYQSHKYKSAFNMFTEKEMTPEERIALSSFVSDLYAEYVKMIETGRGAKLKKPVQQIIDEGPYYEPEVTVELGLVDQLIYEDQLKDTLKKDFGFKNKISSIENKYQYDWALMPSSKIAVIYASGNIMMGKSSPGKTIGSSTLSETIEKARKNSEIDGIILRVNSGGGSAQASDIIANEVKLCKTGKHPKPIVVSMSGAAASGGYYISAFADRIIAEPATITGSIGVTGLGLHAERMFKKIHVNWSSIKYGERSDLGSMTRPPTTEETEMMRAMTESFYKKFVTVCATGRKMSYENVDAIAQGRVWTGNQALANGLVDELGGMKTAVTALKKIAKIKGKAELIEYQSNSSSMEIRLGISAKALTPSVELPGELGMLQDIFMSWQQYGNEKFLMLTPYDLTQWNK